MPQSPCPKYLVLSEVLKLTGASGLYSQARSSFSKPQVIPSLYLLTLQFSFFNLCLGNGWFLDDVVIKDPTTNHEYTFFCHRLVGTLYLEQIHFILVSGRLICFGQMESLFNHSWSLVLCWVTFLNINFRGCFFYLQRYQLCLSSFLMMQI